MIRAWLSLYHWNYPVALLRMLEKHNGHPLQFLKAFWQTTNFNDSARPVDRATRTTVLLLRL